MNTYQARVFNTALSLLQNREDAEDVAQEVFIEVYRSVSKFKGESTLSTWLYRIAVNRALDLQRSRKTQKRFAFLRSLFKEDSVEPRYEQGHFEHPGAALENAEQSRILFACVDRLPERQKAAFVLHKVEGLSLKETGKALEISEGAVESLLSRATQALRASLGNYYDKHYRRKS